MTSLRSKPRTFADLTTRQDGVQRSDHYIEAKIVESRSATKSYRVRRSDHQESRRSNRARRQSPIAFDVRTTRGREGRIAFGPLEVGKVESRSAFGPLEVGNVKSRLDHQGSGRSNRVRRSDH